MNLVILDWDGKYQCELMDLSLYKEININVNKCVYVYVFPRSVPKRSSE